MAIPVPKRVRDAIQASWTSLNQNSSWWPEAPDTQAIFPLLNVVAYLVGHVNYLENRIAQLELQAVPVPIVPPIEDPVILPPLGTPDPAPTPPPTIPDTPLDPLQAPNLVGKVKGVN